MLARLGWSSVQQVFRVTRQRTLRDPQTGASTTSTEVAYGLTRLRRSQADAQALLGFNRRHWGIESQVHSPRDVTFGEDAHHAHHAHHATDPGTSPPRGTPPSPCVDCTGL